MVADVPAVSALLLAAVAASCAATDAARALVALVWATVRACSA
jgi:hypothetical protein